MKKIIPLFIAALLLAGNTFAQTQIPNGSFENWTTGNPDSWGTSDGVLVGFGLPDPGTAEQETTPANVYAGSSAVLLTTKNVSTPLGARDVPGVVSLGKIGLNITTFSPFVTGATYTDRPDSIRFAAKFTSGPSSTDTGVVVMTLTRWANNRANVVSQVFVPIAPSATYTLFTQKLQYQTNNQPDTLLIQAISGSSQNVVIDSKLWVDDFSFIGIDSSFRAYINPNQDVDACAGDTLTFRSDPSATDTFQWYKDNTPINGANQELYRTTANGAYSVKVTHAGTDYYSDTVNVTFHALPVATYTVDAAQDTLCSNAPSVTLTGGSPLGGEYSGTGVSNNSFSPGAAGVGQNTITYTVSDNFGCSASADQTILVRVCTGIESIAANDLLSVYPNPANSNITITLPGETFALQITDLNGRVLVAEKTVTERTTINCSNFATGTYFVKVSNQQFQVTRRFVKE